MDDAELKRLVDCAREVFIQLRTEMRSKWKRDLPLEELLFDRWERAKSLGFGPGSSIYHNAYVYGDVKVGRDTWIGPLTMLDGLGGLTIDDYGCISSGVHIYTHDTVRRYVSGLRTEMEKAPVKIGKCCYIGSQTVIAKGVTIGDHCIIGAKSFVNRDIPSYSLAVGAPCRRVGRVSVAEDGAVTWELEDRNAGEPVML